MQSRISDLPGAGDRDCWQLLSALEPEDIPSKTLLPEALLQSSRYADRLEMYSQALQLAPACNSKVGKLVSSSGGAGDATMTQQTRLCLHGTPRKEITKTGSLRTSRAAAPVGAGSWSGRPVSPPSCRSRTCGGSRGGSRRDRVASEWGIEDPDPTRGAGSSRRGS